MAKVTSKLQLTVPKTIADIYGIRPGDELRWIPNGEAIRVEMIRPGMAPGPALTTQERLELFEQAMKRQDQREDEARKAGMHPTQPAGGRGWTREELYDRGRTR